MGRPPTPLAASTEDPRAAGRFDRFRATRRFDHLDGLRAVSILLVLADHTGDPLWTPLRGYLGVSVFFVISGFIITTLLLREESVRGRVSIRGFFVRRAFRILPLYHLALVVYAVLVLGLGLGSDPRGFVHRLPYYLSYTNELGGSGTFSHTWSLAVEEKFYLLWPLLAFAVVPLRHRRATVAAALVVAATAAAYLPHTAYLAIYLPILAGCLLAVVLHSARGFGVALRLTHPVPAVLLVVLAIVVDGLDRSTTYVHVGFDYAVAAAFPVLLLQPVAVRVLAWRPLVFLGRRSYAVYLFHPIIGNALSRVLPPGTDSTVAQLARFVLLLGVSLAVAHLLFRFFEQPLIAVGRRVTGSPLPVESVPAEVSLPAGEPAT